MPNNNIEKIVKTIILGSIDERTNNTTLFWNHIDEIDCIAIVMKCEQRFGVNISTNEIKKLKTVGDLINLIQTKTNTIESKLNQLSTTIATLQQAIIDYEKVL